MEQVRDPDWKWDIITFNGNMTLQTRSRATLHWIQKGNAEKAARSARDLGHVANGIINSAHLYGADTTGGLSVNDMTKTWRIQLLKKANARNKAYRS